MRLYQFDCCSFLQSYNSINMNFKIILLILITLFLEASTYNIATIDGKYDTCFYLPIGNISKDRKFNYTITSAWTPEQAVELEDGTLNTSDFIHVAGWRPYRRPNPFFVAVGKRGPKLTRKLIYIKKVLQGSDAPQFGLSTSDLEFAFGYPSKAVLYQVPSGKALITLRFQDAVASDPYIGKWSVLVDLVDDDFLGFKLKLHTLRIKLQSIKTRLNPLDVASVLNIVPSFIENSIFWTFDSSPPTGFESPVVYQGFVEVIRAGQQILAGPIYDGQPGIVQVKDVVSDRSPCA